jgi:hypothetical protein
MGMVNAVAAQTRRYQVRATASLAQIDEMISIGDEIWKNNVDTFKLCLVNLNEVIDQFVRRGERR